MLYAALSFAATIRTQKISWSELRFWQENRSHPATQNVGEKCGISWIRVGEFVGAYGRTAAENVLADERNSGLMGEARRLQLSDSALQIRPAFSKWTTCGKLRFRCLSFQNTENKANINFPQLLTRLLGAGVELVRSSDQFPKREFHPMEVMSPAVKPEFEAVRRNRIYEEIARQIEKMITEKMRPGDMLPPERQLAEMFGVSRSSIRDAIRTLELSGFVEARQGLGTVVREHSADSVVNPLTSILVQKRKQVSELLDVRKMIEPPLAARAAVHATADEVAEMQAILLRQKEKMGLGELAIDEDAEFHYAIALAADNSVVLKVIDVLMDLLRDTRERSLQVAGRPERSMAGHQEILDAIKRQDAPGAEAAMCRHIEAVENIVLTKL